MNEKKMRKEYKETILKLRQYERKRRFLKLKKLNKLFTYM